MRRENNAQHYQLALDALLLLAIGLAFFFFVVTTRTGQNVAFGDNTWYLNRADLLWRGIRDDAYVYNIVFPLLTGIVNFVLRDLVVSGMVVELVALYGIAVGTYILGRMLYSRRVGLLAAIVVSANPELYNGARYFGGDILFVNTVL